MWAGEIQLSPSHYHVSDGTNKGRWWVTAVAKEIEHVYTSNEEREMVIFNGHAVVFGALSLTTVVCVCVCVWIK